MKKIFSSFICFIMVLFLVGCSNKTKIEGSKFREEMEKNGYIVIDTIVSQDDSEKNFVAQEKEGKYQIEFYELSSKDKAKEKFSNYKKGIDNENTNNFKKKSVKTGNYEKYTLETDDIYFLISRIDNTMIYLSVDTEYKNDINKIIKELGY